MALSQPKQTKYRKAHKGRNRGVAKRGRRVSFGKFGIRCIRDKDSNKTSTYKLTSRQIESARRAITRYIKRGGKVWIRVFPDQPVTKKPLEVRQGGGKGSVDHWIAKIQPGRVLFEIAGVSREVAKEAFRRAAAKLPFKIQFVEEEVM